MKKKLIIFGTAVLMTVSAAIFAFNSSSDQECCGCAGNCGGCDETECVCSK